MRRLRRDHPELHGLVLSGALSPHRAAIAAGFRRKPGPRPKRPADPSDHRTAEEQLELWLGPGERGSLFNDAAELREAWTRHKDLLMERWGRSGRRPMGWWEFEAGDLEYPGYDFERSLLYERGMLTEAERVLLEAEWRKAFERAQISDIPRTLVEAWSAPVTPSPPEPDHAAAAQIE
jgi:hypothetical protein